MFTTLGALVTGAAYECADEGGFDLSNPVEDCLRPLLNGLSSYVFSVALSSTSIASETAKGIERKSPSGSDYLEELWYRRHHYERFKRDLVAEARRAGFYEPEQQYMHIKQKYIDETTRRNTVENIQRVSINNLDGDDITSIQEQSCEDERRQVVANTSPNRQKKRGHKRSVSFDMENSPHLLGLPPLDPNGPRSS